MKRHLLVTNDFPPKVGGIQNYLWELWKRLDPTSYVVLTASSDDGATAFDALQAERGIRIERVSARTLFFPTAAALAAVRKSAADNEVDLVLFDPVLPLGLFGPARRCPLRRRPSRRGGHGPGPDSGFTGRARPRAPWR